MRRERRDLMAVKRMDNVGIVVEDLDDTLARLRPLGATVVDEIVTYENIYRLCYIRGPEGILNGLAQELARPAKPNPVP